MTVDHDSLPRANTVSVTETSWGSATTAGTLAWAIDQANMSSATGNLDSITGLNADGLDRFALVEAGDRLDVTTAGIVNSVNFDFSGRNITPGFEALARATLNLDRVLINKAHGLAALPGGLVAGSDATINVSSSTSGISAAARPSSSPAGCRSSLGRLPAWKNAAVCGGSAISRAPPPQAISGGDGMSVEFTGQFSTVE